MKILIERIVSDEQRKTVALARGEVVSHRVDISVDGQTRTFTVHVKINVLSQFDASLVYGEELLEELLRFDPVALNAVYRAVGNYRRGLALRLPIVIVDSGGDGRAADVPAG